MKNLSLLICLLIMISSIQAQESETIKLNAPNLDRGEPIMKAIAQRASSKEFDAKSLEIQDLSDLLWAANGVNRPEEKKRTASSAMNSQDVDLYVFIESGVYLYNAFDHVLESVVKEDHRNIFSRQENDLSPALICLTVSDISRFKVGDDDLRLEWGAMDAALVTQNILLFCASENMPARPRAGMNKEKIKELLGLTDSQYPMLNIPVSYKAE